MNSVVTIGAIIASSTYKKMEKLGLNRRMYYTYLKHFTQSLLIKNFYYFNSKK